MPLLLPSFWILPSEPSISIEQVHPPELWDANTNILQPVSETLLSEKIGILKLSFRIAAFLVLGVFVTASGPEPWCKIIMANKPEQQLVQIFEDFRLSARESTVTHKGERRANAHETGIVYPGPADNSDDAGLEVTVTKKAVSSTNTYVVQVVPIRQRLPLRENRSVH